MTIAEFLRAVETQLPDNNEGLITPAALRAVFVLLIQLLREGVDQ